MHPRHRDRDQTLVRDVVLRSGVGGMIESVSNDPVFEFDCRTRQTVSRIRRITAYNVDRAVSTAAVMASLGRPVVQPFRAVTLPSSMDRGSRPQVIDCVGPFLRRGASGHRPARRNGEGTGPSPWSTATRSTGASPPCSKRGTRQTHRRPSGPRRRRWRRCWPAGALAGPGTISRVHDVGAVRDYLVVAAVLAGRADLPADARLAEGLRGEH